MRHKHADLIKEWIEDTSIVIQTFCNGKWEDIKWDPSFYQSHEYRKKPKTMRYRVALLKKPDHTNPHPAIINMDQDLLTLQLSSLFVRWLDEEKEVEI